jgi:hypothetical protein
MIYFVSNENTFLNVSDDLLLKIHLGFLNMTQCVLYQECVLCLCFSNPMLYQANTLAKWDPKGNYKVHRECFICLSGIFGSLGLLKKFPRKIMSIRHFRVGFGKPEV